MTVYGSWITDAVSAYLTGATVKAMLVTNAYVPDSDETTPPTASEVTGTGYTAGGVDVTSLISVAYDSVGDQVGLLFSGDIDFGDITVTGIGGVVVYVATGKPLGADIFDPIDWPGGSSFTYTPGPDGFLVVSV